MTSYDAADHLNAAPDWGDCSPAVEELLELIHQATWTALEHERTVFGPADAEVIADVYADQERYLTDPEREKARLFETEMRRLNRQPDGVPLCLELAWIEAMKPGISRLHDERAIGGDR